MKNYLSQASLTNPLIPKAQAGAGAAFFQGFLPAMVGLAYVVGTIIFFFIFLMGAIQWISSGGDKASLEGARGKLSNALVGIVVLFSTFAIIKVIEAFFGINILSID